jgi:release factor glutamine methyltransferase
MTKSIGAVLADLSGRLPGDTPALDAQLLLARVLRKPRSWVLAHPEKELSPARQQALSKQIERLEAGQPLPYVLGRWEFFGLEFLVDPGVLIPRPETELLVETALGWLKRPASAARRMIDIGTGSGCIGIALAVHVPDLQVTATDISPQALEVARRNAAAHGLADRIAHACCDLFPSAHETYDLIVANLPYIPSATLHSLPIYGREPTLALDGGADGLDVLRRLLAAAPERLRPGGLLLMEIEASQGSAVLSIACDTFQRAEIHLHRDLAGRDRLLEVQV